MPLERWRKRQPQARSPDPKSHNTINNMIHKVQRNAGAPGSRLSSSRPLDRGERILPTRMLQPHGWSVLMSAREAGDQTSRPSLASMEYGPPPRNMIMTKTMSQRNANSEPPVLTPHPPVACTFTITMKSSTNERRYYRTRAHSLQWPPGSIAALRNFRRGPSYKRRQLRPAHSRRTKPAAGRREKYDRACLNWSFRRDRDGLDRRLNAPPGRATRPRGEPPPPPILSTWAQRARARTDPIAIRSGRNGATSACVRICRACLHRE
jgi:hypothetical protein